MPAPANLPPKAQRMWEDVYESARSPERGFSEERAAKMAWGAVKRFYRKKGGVWVARKHPKEHVAARGRVYKA